MPNFKNKFKKITWKKSGLSSGHQQNLIFLLFSFYKCIETDWGQMRQHWNTYNNLIRKCTLSNWNSPIYEIQPYKWNFKNIPGCKIEGSVWRLRKMRQPLLVYVGSFLFLFFMFWVTFTVTIHWFILLTFIHLNVTIFWEKKKRNVYKSK